MTNYKSRNESVSEAQSKELNVLTSYRLNDFKKKVAFTLAEVLITLGIIGIVAAMTIPTLVSKIQEAHFHVKWKECYALLNNAMRMTAVNNPKLLVKESGSDNSVTAEFLDAFLENLKVVDMCSPRIVYGYANCQFETTQKWSGAWNVYSSYKTLAGGVLNSYDFGARAALLNNGAAIYIGGLWSGQTIVVDVNNAQVGPNVLGKDIYAISLWGSSISNGQRLYIEDFQFRPYGAEGTRTEKAGYAGCDESIGANSDANGNINALFEAPGAGCSYKYLYEK